LAFFGLVEESGGARHRERRGRALALLPSFHFAASLRTYSACIAVRCAMGIENCLVAA
jgi:hypothetical protein